MLTEERLGEGLKKRGFNCLVYGDIGSGKTTLFATFPRGRKFAYFFDPGGGNVFLGMKEMEEDLTYVEFGLEKSDFKVQLQKYRPTAKPISAEVYAEFEKDFQERIESGFFNDIDYFMFDSVTTFSQSLLTCILSLSGRPGSFPQLADYGAQAYTAFKVFSAIVNLPCNTYLVAHEEHLKDEVTGKIIGRPLVTGRSLRSQLPAIFDEVYHLTSQDGKYILETKPSGIYLARSRLSEKGMLDARVDVTIDFKKPLHTQGLSRVLPLAKQSPTKQQTLKGVL